MASTSRTQDDAWKASTDHAMQAIVTIQIAARFPFGNDPKWCGQGTGFVVDKGIILTNRHMVSEAPMMARAIFQSGARQCPIWPYYIDPIHDFAFCQFNPEDVRGLSLQPIRLQPEKATVGREIRVLGNDTGRVMSILPGVISRVDCNPPHWDSMINYIQASADVAGGSSGSPVIIVDGSAVALVSGSFFFSSTDIYLPLDLPLRALYNLRSKPTIPRGTIQSIWRLEKPAYCHERGLSYEKVQKLNPGGSGLLVAQKILPNGPSDTRVKEADVLRTVDDQIVTSLPQFEQLMDGAVGNALKVQVWRHGKTLEYALQVQDLWILPPIRLLEYAGSVFEDLRYQTAVNHNVPIGGVLSNAEGSFILEGDGVKLIRSLNHQSTPNLDAFIKVARGIPDLARVAVEYQILDDGPSSCFQLITIDRHWLHEKMVLRSRKHDDISSFHITNLGPAPTAAPLPSQTLPTKPMAEHYPILQKIVSNMVQVRAQTPYKTNGAFKEDMSCAGFVINANEGFVITARSFMPSTMCTLHIVFADSIEVPATKVYDHALGFAVIRYDTSLIEGSIGSVTFNLKVPKAQDKMTIYGPDINGSGPCPMETTVTSIGPLTGDYVCEHFYHPVNTDVLHLQADGCSDGAGVLLDEAGDLQGLWLPFYLTDDGIKWVGVQLSLLLPAFEKLQNGILPPECRMLDVELDTVHKNDVRVLGVSEDAVKTFPGRGFVRVKKVPSSHQNGLEPGDIIVKLGKNLVTQMSDLCDMFAHPTLRMSVIRRQVEVVVDVPTITISSRQSDRVVWFAGAQFEPPYSPVHFCTRKLYSQIFVTGVQTGSPADMYKLPLHRFVTQVQGVATVSFDDFTKEIKKLPNDQFCQFTLVDLKGYPETVSLMTNRRDFEAVDARQKEGSRHGWHFQVL